MWPGYAHPQQPRRNSPRRGAKATPAERAAFVEHECAGDSALHQRVESLLQANAQTGQFLEQPSAGVSADTSLVSVGVLAPAEKCGDKIGRYKLLEKIGEGGFGDVWMAEQEEPVRRRVALKIIKLGMDTREVIARFEAERQALALMDHPHIAKVFDGGATHAGRHYFVMELVRGVPMTEFCEQSKLRIAERLELFIQVCAAVQHAHQKGIIHRDIKPSKVLVTVQDDRRIPKVIDFGIAKATAQRLTEKTLFTRLNQFIGTPAYMSPEQTGANREDIDTRSDIYLAQNAVREGNYGLARQALLAHRPRPGVPDLRGFEWSYFVKLCQGDKLASWRAHSNVVNSIAVTPDGKLIASASRDHQAKVWDAASYHLLDGFERGFFTGWQVPCLFQCRPDDPALAGAERQGGG